MRGGARPNAGRKKSGKHTATFWVTAEEESSLRKHLEQLRKPKQHAPTLEELEAKGQTTIMEFVKDEPVSLAKHIVKDIPHDEFYTWQHNIGVKLLQLKKVSKNKAAEYLAAETSIVVNALLADKSDAMAQKKLAFLEREIPKVLDARKHRTASDNLVKAFLEEQHYMLSYNNTTTEGPSRTWIKNSFL